MLPAGGARRGILDFRGTSDVLFVGDGGTMAMENIMVAGFALANGRASPMTDSVFFPTVQLAPGATVSHAAPVPVNLVTVCWRGGVQNTWLLICT